jgi:thymidylate synthase (FAD)
MGDELDIVNAARLSYDKHVDSLGERDIGLLNFLLKHRHGTPFEMVEFMFQVRCPLSVAREWHRHRIASYNEVSGRYVKQTQDCYNPTPDAMRTQKGKPGAYTFEPIEDPYINQYCRDIMKDHYKECYEIYECLLENGVAKELARNVLPQGMFTEFRFKTNARSLMNFLSLRNAPNAMYEIRRYAEEMESMFAILMPHTHESFVKNGRVAP